MSEVPSTHKSDLLRGAQKSPLPTTCTNSNTLLRADSLLSKAVMFLFLPAGSLTLRTPLQKGKSISHHNVSDSYQIPFFKDTGKGAAPGMEDRGDQD